MVLEFVPWLFNQLNNSLYTKARCTQSSVRLGMTSTLPIPTTISPGSKSHELNQHGLAPGERVSLKHDYILILPLLRHSGEDKLRRLYGYWYYTHISQVWSHIHYSKKKKSLTCCTIACPEPKCFQVLYEFLSLHHNLSGPISVSRYPSTIKKNSISSNIHFSLRFLYCQTHIFIDVAIKIAYQKAQV